MSKSITTYTVLPKENTQRKINPDKVFTFFLYLIATILLLVVLYPIYFVVIASFSEPAEVSAGNVIWHPIGLTLAGYKQLFQYSQLWTGYKNTIIYCVLGTFFSLVMNIPTAYALSRKDLFGKKLLTVFYLIPMFFTGGLIPTYLIVRNFGLLDTRWVMVLPFSVATYYIIVARTFFNNSIPKDLWEAAQLDGCGNIQFFFQIVLPLSKAVISVIALWTAVGQWNSYFNALVYLRNPDLQPLQLFLRNILINNQSLAGMMTGKAAVEARELADLIKYALIVISSAPIMCLYPFVQKYFNQGIMIGSLKG